MSASSKLGTPNTEPVRRNVGVAGLVVVLGSLFTALGLADTLTVQTVLVALGAATVEAGALWAGVERARDKAWSPASAGEIMDAETVIREAEGG